MRTNFTCGTALLFSMIVVMLAVSPAWAQDDVPTPGAVGNDLSPAGEPQQVSAIGAFLNRIPTGRVFLDNDLTHWIALFLVLLLSLMVGKVLSFGLEKHANRLNSKPGWSTLESVIRAIDRPVMLMFFVGGLSLARGFMQLEFHLATGEVMNVNGMWDQTTTILFSVSIGWVLYRLVDVVEHVLARFAAKTDTLLDDQLVPLVRKALRIVVVIIAALYVARKVFHADLGALVAGLGIGGLAVAFAAKDALSNLFGSIMILTDKPFRIGDRIKVGSTGGNVEEVGFRSTRIRTLEGHLVTVPNATIANADVENISQRPTLKRVLNVTITYDTPPEKVQQAVDILTEMLEVRKDNFDPENLYKVFFNDFNAESLNIVVYYWYTPAEWWDYLAFNHGFNMELLRRFNEEGIEFAFPTQTVYLKSEGALEADVTLRKDVTT